MELRVELELVTLRSRPEARWRVGHLSDGPPRCPLHWEFLKAHISVLQKFWFSGSRLQSKKLYFITLPRWFWGRQSVDPLLASVFILWLGGLLSGVGTSREIERAVLSYRPHNVLFQGLHTRSGECVIRLTHILVCKGFSSNNQTISSSDFSTWLHKYQIPSINYICVICYIWVWY